MATPTTDQLPDDLVGRLIRLATPLFGATALSAGFAFIMGWQYERAYLEEWGLAFSAFSYAPHELMVKSTTTLLWSSSPVLLLILGLAGRHSFIAGRPTRLTNEVEGTLWAFVGAGTVLVSILLVPITGNQRWGLSLFWLGYLVVSAALILRASTSSELRPWLIVTLMATMLLVVFVVPRALGEHDASQHIKHPDRLPLVQVSLRHSIGIDGERQSENGFVTGPWRLVRSNDGHLWLTPDRKNSGRVLQIDADDVASIEYTRDSEPIPTPTPQAP